VHDARDADTNPLIQILYNSQKKNEKGSWKIINSKKRNRNSPKLIMSKKQKRTTITKQNLRLMNKSIEGSFSRT